MENKSHIRILIVDDHQMFIDGIKLVLRKSPVYFIAAETTSGKEVPDIISKQNIDLVILDINMPEITGIELTKYIKKNHPDIKVLILTSYNEREIILEIFESEADGYILKNAGKQELISALNKIIEGGLYYCNEVTSIMLNSIKIEKRREEKIKDLTERELEIIKLISKELTNNEIAEILCISPLTVETHRKHILAKTKSKSVVGLIKYAIENKLI